MWNQVSFPAKENWFSMNEEELKKLREANW